MSLQGTKHRILLGLVALGIGAAARPAEAATVTNPFLWADIPDPAMIRVGPNYYMSFTTMHMAPGVPLLKSTDLVNWKTVGYVYQTLANSDAMNLNNGKNAYGKGAWASSLRYKNGTFYVLTPSYTTNKTHLNSTKDIEKGPWKEVLLPFYHDPSLVLDDDGRNYVVYGSGDIRIVELAADLSGLKSGGMSATLLPGASSVAGSGMIVAAEGSHVVKKDGWYYVFNICWPSGGSRTEICHRSKSLAGPWEAKVVFNSNGVAQGSVIQDSSGGWWGYLFQDNGGVGRSPWIMPVTWANDWPVFNGGTAPKTLTMATNDATGTGIVTSDDFNSTSMKLEWQWNHNPDNANWSLTARPGHYRITTSRTDANLLSAKNSLTQRSFGPKCSGRVALDASGLKDGDVAGLAGLQDTFGFVGVKNSGGSLSIVKYRGQTQETSVAIAQKRVYLRIDMDFTNRTDKATFFYSLDSTTWKSIGTTMPMPYTLGQFMGYRFALFDYATKAAGGYADFDWFQIGASATGSIDLHPPSTSVRPTGVRVSLAKPIAFASTISTSGHELSIQYDVARAGRVEVFLADPSGKVLDRIVNRTQSAGSYQVRSRTGAIPEGHYLLVGRLDGVAIEGRPIAVTK